MEKHNSINNNTILKIDLNFLILRILLTENKNFSSYKFTTTQSWNVLMLNPGKDSPGIHRISSKHLFFDSIMVFIQHNKFYKICSLNNRESLLLKWTQEIFSYTSYIRSYQFILIDLLISIEKLCGSQNIFYTNGR